MKAAALELLVVVLACLAGVGVASCGATGHRVAEAGHRALCASPEPPPYLPHHDDVLVRALWRIERAIFCVDDEPPGDAGIPDALEVP